MLLSASTDCYVKEPPWTMEKSLEPMLWRQLGDMVSSMIKPKDLRPMESTVPWKPTRGVYSVILMVTSSMPSIPGLQSSVAFDKLC